MFRYFIGLVVATLSIVVTLNKDATAVEPDCIPESETVDYCVLEQGSVNIQPYAVSTAPTWDQEFLVYNPTPTNQQVRVRVGCIVESGEMRWFQNVSESDLEVIADLQVEIPADNQVVVPVFVMIFAFGDNGCTTWQDGDPYAYIASADIVGENNPMVIYGSTKFTLKSDYDRSKNGNGSTTTTVPPGTGGGDARFLDVPLEHTFNNDIEWLAAEGITKGCDPPDNFYYCPDDPVSRGQMAAFQVRGFNLEFTGYADICTYVDVSSTHTFFKEVGILCQYGITKGCNPPDNTYFCPEEDVTRDQMAAFLVRALGLPRSEVDQFTDDDDSVFESDIQALAASGITRGCNPPANDRFCPEDPVTRGQMAAFLHRALAP